MPLKPIFDKSPLMKLASLPLAPGQARCALKEAHALYRLHDAAENHPALWEGIFRLACAVTAKPREEKVSGWISDALSRQEDSGALPGTVTEQVAVLRAAWAMYEYDAQRALLEKVMKWCGWACENWEAVLADFDVRTRPADLMELLCAVYRVTGIPAVLSLCERLRAQGMDWSGALRTFSVQQEMRRIVSREELDASLEKEAGDESGFYTRQYLVCHGETLADGLRAAMAMGRYSGSATELTAAQAGWERISRYHGAVCGGTTADETLAGASPARSVSTAALGAWAEAMTAPDENWAYEALDVMLSNGMPAVIRSEGVAAFQRVNTLGGDAQDDCYIISDDCDLRALNRLCRGYAAAIASAVTSRPDGAQANLFLPGKYAVANDRCRMLLTIGGQDDRRVVKVQVKEPVKAVLRLRIPAWTRETAVFLNGLEISADCEKLWVVLERTWNDGDEIVVEMKRELRVAEGHHQSACVMLGSQVLACQVPVQGVWNVALSGDPMIDETGRVTAPVRAVPGWRSKDNTPSDVPVLPQTEGEVMIAEMRPYAQTQSRLALLPRGKRA